MRGSAFTDTNGESTSISGTTGDDTLIAGSDFSPSNNSISANGGYDLLNLTASEGNNTVNGGADRDVLNLGTEDRIIGNDGNDRTDTDKLHNGKPHNDIFAGSGGNNIITDFTIGEDVIGIAELEVSFGDLSIIQSEDGATISANGNNLAVVEDISFDLLNDEANFAFAQISIGNS